MRQFRNSLLLLGTLSLLSACSTTSMSGKKVELRIASQMVDCVGVVPQKCLLVETISQEKDLNHQAPVKAIAESTDWHYFYQTIEGFEYQPGYEYQLSIEVMPKSFDQNDVADRSTIRYRLIEVISKVAKESHNLPKTLHYNVAPRRA